MWLPIVLLEYWHGFCRYRAGEDKTIAVSSVGCWKGEASMGLLNVSAIFFASHGNFLPRSILVMALASSIDLETGKIG